MRDLVNDNGSLLLVMARFGISLGFGDKSVRDVCRAHHVDENTFLEVANLSRTGSITTNRSLCRL